jgi:cytochrome c-type biogenesis protein CcmH/NrfF
VNWALWLAIPVVVTVLAAIASWLRARPKRVPGTRAAMREHEEFLDALERATRANAAADHD